jgi:hypothetical protein
MPVEEKLVAEIDAAIEAGDESFEIVEDSIPEVEGEENVEQPAAEADATVSDEEGAEEVAEGDVPVDEDQDGEREEDAGQARLTNEILTRAVRAGLSLDDAQAFPNDQTLALVCGRLEQAASELEETRKAVEKTKEETPEDDPLDVFGGLDPEEFDPDTIKLLGTLADQIRTQRDEIKSLRSGQEGVANANQAAAAQEIESWFDAQVAGLGKDFHNTLGEGGYRTLQQGSPHLAARDAVAEQMAVMLAGYSAVGRVPPPREEVFGTAVSIILGDQIAKQKEAAVQRDLRNLSKQHLHKGRSSREKQSEPDTDPEGAVARLVDETYFAK